MFNIDFDFEKNKNLVNFIRYGATALAVVLLTIVLVFAAGGYDIDKSTGKIIHNGLVMLASEPVPADVYVNGESENDATRSKLSLPAAQYEILLKRDGYYDWSKKINVEGSDVVWLYYPRLIPTDIKTSEIEAFKNVAMASQSPDYKSLLVHETAGDLQMLLVNTEDQESTPKAVSIPLEAVTQELNQISKFSVIDWAQDNRTVLLRHVNGSTNELILLDVTKPQEALNLTRIFELEMSASHFVDDAKNKLYAIVNSSLRRIDVGARTVTGALIDNVTQYSSDDGLVAAVHGKTGETKVSILDGDKLTTFEDLESEAKNYRVGIDQFDGDRHLALADKVTGLTSIYRDPVSQMNDNEQNTVLAALKLEDMRYLSFSPNGQFAMVQSANDFRLFDFDVDKKRAFKSKLEIAKDTEAEWIDGFHLSVVDAKSVAHFLDYDGLNSHPINTIDKSLGVFYTNKIESAYFFNTQKSGSDILNLSSLLVVEQ